MKDLTEILKNAINEALDNNQKMSKEEFSKLVMPIVSNVKNVNSSDIYQNYKKASITINDQIQTIAYSLDENRKKLALKLIAEALQALTKYLNSLIEYQNNRINNLYKIIIKLHVNS